MTWKLVALVSVLLLAAQTWAALRREKKRSDAVSEMLSERLKRRRAEENAEWLRVKLSQHESGFLTFPLIPRLQPSATRASNPGSSVQIPESVPSSQHQALQREHAQVLAERDAAIQTADEKEREIENLRARLSEFQLH